VSNAIFARSATTEKLIDLLIGCPEGEMVTFAEMMRVTNRDIQHKDRHLLTTALNSVRKESAALFSAVYRVGVQRLRPEEVMVDGRRRVKRIVRAAHRGSTIMDAVDPARLNPDQRLAHAATRGVLASIEASGKVAKAIPSGSAGRDPVVALVKS